jgi:hypothetical protein
MLCPAGARASRVMHAGCKSLALSQEQLSGVRSCHANTSLFHSLAVLQLQVTAFLHHPCSLRLLQIFSRVRNRTRAFHA